MFLHTDEQFNMAKFSDLLKLECDYCKSIFYRKKSAVYLLKWLETQKIACSKQCRNQHRKTEKPKRYCLTCGKETKTKFCSHTCSAKYSNIHRQFDAVEHSKQTKNVNCSKCGKLTSINIYASAINCKCNECLPKKSKIISKKIILQICSHCNKLFRKKQFCKRYFCSKICRDIYKFNKIKQQFENGQLKYRKSIRPFLLERDGYKCVICQQKEWMNKLIPLQVDHIDGNASNNKPENLRMICHNCDAQLPTFAGRNWGKGRKSRGLKAYD